MDINHIRDLKPKVENNHYYTAILENNQRKFFIFNCIFASIICFFSFRMAAHDEKVPDFITETEYRYINTRDCPESDPLCLFVTPEKSCPESDPLCLFEIASK